MAKLAFLTQTPQGGSRKTRKTLVTIDTFFESDGNVGYFKRETFNSMMEEIYEKAAPLFSNYRNFFNCVKDGFNITNSISKQTHSVSQAEYYHMRFSRGKVLTKATIYEQEGLGHFISDYANGLIETNFTLDELIEASKNR